MVFNSINVRFKYTKFRTGSDCIHQSCSVVLDPAVALGLMWTPWAQLDHRAPDPSALPSAHSSEPDPSEPPSVLPSSVRPCWTFVEAAPPFVVALQDADQVLFAAVVAAGGNRDISVAVVVEVAVAGEAVAVTAAGYFLYNCHTAPDQTCYLGCNLVAVEKILGPGPAGTVGFHADCHTDSG